MAVSFPLSWNTFRDRVRIESGEFNLVRNDTVSGLGNGQPINAELASPLWGFKGSTGPIQNDDAEGVAALFEMLEHPGRTVYLANPRKLAPRMDKDGSIFGGSNPIMTVNANRHQASFSGLPPGYVLSAGDMFMYMFGASPFKRAMHRICETVTADAAGVTPMFEVMPHFRPGYDAVLAIFLFAPSIPMKIIPGSYRSQSDGPLFERFEFSAIQKLEP